MSETMTLQAFHKKQAVDTFNQTWDLLDKEDRTDEDGLLMIHKAHTSRYHWGQVESGGPKQYATGEWQISRVYAVMGNGQSALYHGQASLRYCEEGALEPFDYAFAYEAIARAYALLNDKDQANAFLAKGKEVAGKIDNADNQAYYLNELNTISL